MNSVDSESYISKDEFKRNNKVHMMNVVGNNLKCMSERQQQRAKNARKVF